MAQSVVPLSYVSLGKKKLLNYISPTTVYFKRNILSDIDQFDYETLRYLYNLSLSKPYLCDSLT